MTVYKIAVSGGDEDQVFDVTAPNLRSALLTAAAEPVARDNVPALTSSETVSPPDSAVSEPAGVDVVSPPSTPALPTSDAHLLGLVW